MAPQTRKTRQATGAAAAGTNPPKLQNCEKEKDAASLRLRGQTQEEYQAQERIRDRLLGKRNHHKRKLAARKREAAKQAELDKKKKQESVTVDRAPVDNGVKPNSKENAKGKKRKVTHQKAEGDLPMPPYNPIPTEDRAISSSTTTKDRAISSSTTTKDRAILSSTTTKDRAISSSTTTKDREISSLTVAKDRAITSSTTTKDRAISSPPPTTKVTELTEMETRMSAGNDSSKTSQIYSSRYPIKAGDKFASYKQLRDKIALIRSNTYGKLTMQTCRLLATKKSKYPDKYAQANMDLIYHGITYCCAANRTCRRLQKGEGANGENPRYCKAGIWLSLSKENTHLVVTRVIHDHNHNIFTEMEEEKPQKKKKRKRFQQKKSEKSPTQADCGVTKSSCIWDKLKLVLSTEGSSVELWKEENIVALFFQDKEMKATYGSFPEIVFFQSPIQCTKLNMALYVAFGIDSIGQAEIITIFLSNLDPERSISKMMEDFQKHNPSCAETRAVLVDANGVGQSILQKTFSSSTIMQCSLHSLRTFSEVVTCDTMDIGPGEEGLAVTLFKKLLYSKSTAEYSRNYKALKYLGQPAVTAYYDDKWHTPRHKWAEQSCRRPTLCLGEKSDAWLEDVCSRVRQVCCEYGDIDVFFDELFSVLDQTRVRRENGIYEEVTLERTIPKTLQLYEAEYAKLVTSFAFQCIQKQISLMADISPKDVVGCVSSCTCPFWTATGLPCAHIFLVRHSKGRRLFRRALVAKRWTRDYTYNLHINRVGSKHVLKRDLTHQGKYQLGLWASEIGMSKVFKIVTDDWSVL